MSQAPGLGWILCARNIALGVCMDRVWCTYGLWNQNMYYTQQYGRECMPRVKVRVSRAVYIWAKLSLLL